MQQGQTSEANRRQQHRVGVVLPAEIYLCNGFTHEPLGTTMHAVVCDLSLGGVRIELVGDAAKAMADAKLSNESIMLKLLSPDLRQFGSMPCQVRWSRANPQGWSIGLLFVDADKIPASALYQQATRSTQEGASPRLVRALAAGLIIASILGLGSVWQVMSQREALSADVTHLRSEVDDVNTMAAHLTQRLSISETETEQARRDALKCLGRAVVSAQRDDDQAAAALVRGADVKGAPIIDTVARDAAIKEPTPADANAATP